MLLGRRRHHSGSARTVHAAGGALRYLLRTRTAVIIVLLLLWRGRFGSHGLEFGEQVGGLTIQQARSVRLKQRAYHVIRHYW